MTPSNYKQIAVIGVSGDADKYGHKIFRDLLNAGYPVKGINRRAASSWGRTFTRTWKSLSRNPTLSSPWCIRTSPKRW